MNVTRQFQIRGKDRFYLCAIFDNFPHGDKSVSGVRKRMRTLDSLTEGWDWDAVKETGLKTELATRIDTITLSLERAGEWLEFLGSALERLHLAQQRALLPFLDALQAFSNDPTTTPVAKEPEPMPLVEDVLTRRLGPARRDPEARDWFESGGPPGGS